MKKAIQPVVFCTRVQDIISLFLTHFLHNLYKSLHGKLTMSFKFFRIFRE